MKDSAGSRVGILVEGHVKPGIAALVHQVDHALSHAFHRAMVMGDMHRNAVPAPDLQRLTEWVQQPVSQGVPGMGNVNPPVLLDCPADRRQFAGVAVGPRRVGQPGREAEGPVAHPLYGQFLHPLQLRRSWQPGVPPHCLHPDRRVGHEVDHVAGNPPVQQVQELGDAAPADIRRRRAVDRRQVSKQVLQVPG